jgi:protein ImuB
VSSEDQVLGVARDLAVSLCERLDGEGLGGRLFVLELFRLDGAVKRLEVGTSRPLRTPGRIAALFAERLAALNEGLEADFGFEQVRLWARTTQPLKAVADDLLDGAGSDGAFVALADRLSARLGTGAVKRLAPAPETRLPERAVRIEPFDAGAAAAWAEEPPAEDAGAPLRPITLFAPPQPIEVTAEIPEGAPQQFRWRRLNRRITAAEGPERLEPEWGRTTESRVRDYYRVEDDQGRRYWVYREGRYGEEPDARWFLHGLFA